MFVSERDRSRGRFIDDVDNIETGDVPGVLRGLAANLVEIRRNRHDDLAKVSQDDLGVVMDFVKYPSLESFRWVMTSPQFLVEKAAA